MDFNLQRVNQYSQNANNSRSGSFDRNAYSRYAYMNNQLQKNDLASNLGTLGGHFIGQGLANKFDGMYKGEKVNGPWWKPDATKVGANTQGGAGTLTGNLAQGSNAVGGAFVPEAEELAMANLPNMASGVAADTIGTMVTTGGAEAGAIASGATTLGGTALPAGAITAGGASEAATAANAATSAGLSPLGYVQIGLLADQFLNKGRFTREIGRGLHKLGINL